jgi:hypothetical protein
MNDERLAEIRKREQAATPGPWWASPSDEGADAQFMAHARTDIPDLLSEVERLKVELLALREQTRWIPVTEKLPEPGVDVLIMLCDERNTDLPNFNILSGMAVGHVDVSASGRVITRPLTALGENRRQWPAWSVRGDDEDYHEASHWRPLPPAPVPSVQEVENG